MSFNTAHRAYADAVMQNEAAKLLRQKRPSTRNAEKASYNATYADDKKLRPDVKKSWWQATAKSTNSMIEDESRKAIRAAYKTLKSQGKLSSLIGTGTLVTATALAGGAALIPAANTDISRRALMIGGAALVGTAFLGSASPAMADNTDYIGRVRDGLRSYTFKTAPDKVREAYGLGGRG